MKLTGTLSAALLAVAVRASEHVRSVAVIGAGAAGASTAYYLRQFADADGVAVNITVLEATDRIGGRTLTVNAYDDPAQRVELGASIFVEINQILWNATQTFGLPLKPAGSSDDNDSDGDAGESGVLAIWDGDRFVYTQDEAASGWWNLAKLVWRYGLAPYKANKLMQSTVRRFLSLYQAPYFPFRSLSARAYELELHYVTGQTGEQYLGQNGIATAFSHDIIQASTRVNYASNLDRIHGLDTMVALAPQGASQVAGGNWQIFARFVAASHAAVLANTTVTHIARAADSPSDAPRYVLTTRSAGQNDTTTDAFDDVVLATPLQFSGITTGPDVLEQALDKIPYVRLHVTLFTSPLPLSPAFFQLPSGAQAPTTVLTTLPAGSTTNSTHNHGAGKAGFFSISTLRTVTNPRTGQPEYLYKIFSPAAVTAAFLTDLLGAKVPAAVVANGAKGVISWYYPHIFHAYPKAYPRVTFEGPVVGNRVYYTSGIESFISTMETSALSGMNVARLIVDDIQGLSSGAAVRVQREEDL